MKKPIMIALDEMSAEEKKLAEALGYTVVDEDLEHLLNAYGSRHIEKTSTAQIIFDLTSMTLEGECVFVKETYASKQDNLARRHRNSIYLANIILHIAYAMNMNIITKEDMCELAAAKLVQMKQEEEKRDQNE